MNLRDIPELTWDTIKRMEDMTYFTHAQIFDNLLIVAQKETNCFVLKTSDGLTVIDAIWPDRRVYDAIIDAIKDISWNPDDIKRLVLTHGHVDHAGCGRYFVEENKVKTYMSQVDNIFWREHPVKENRPETWKDYDITDYIDDGDVIHCGDTDIQVIATPGHTPGCLSYFFPVTDNGEVHMAGIFGGTTPPRNDPEGTKKFHESVDYFVSTARMLNADVMLSNHTAMDNGIERIEYSKKRLAYLPNIYVIGEKGLIEYCEMFKKL